MKRTVQPWSPLQKIAFRIVSAFFLIYISGGFLGFIFRAFVPWFGQHVLNMEKEITIFTNGSGDTTYDYVTMLVYWLLTVVVAIVWSILDRKRVHYDQLLYWVAVLVRYYVGMNMLVYGFYKVFHLQMPSPGLSQLIQPFGDKSPMGLAWSYVGFSKGFSQFTGLAELLAGCFLFFRRTLVLGALLCVAVTLNIVAINLFFDVPVKLFSSTLLFMSLFLLAPDAQRLLNFFLLNKPTEERIYPNYLNKRWMRITGLGLKYLFIIYWFYNGIVNIGINGQKNYGDKRQRPVLYGLYEAELVLRNQDTIPPLTTDTGRWKNLVIEWEKNAMVKTMNDSIQYYRFAVDTVQRKVEIFPYRDSTLKTYLAYQTNGKYLTLRGVLQKDSIYMRLKKRDPMSFRLMNRGFRWINEYPYNR